MLGELMRKATKQKIIVLFIIGIFGMSSIAFIIFSAIAPPNTEKKSLDSLVISGEVDPEIEDSYLQGGYTWLKVYYSEENPRFFAYIDSLPEQYLAGNKPQIVVQKISSSVPYVNIKGPYGEKTVNATESKIFSALCETLLVTPPECGLGVLKNITSKNITSAA